MNRSLVRIVALAAMTSLVGCYGPFRLTKKLHAWNGQIGQKWVNEAAFVGMCIVPVYFFATLADAIVFNSVEFWTGSNPVASRVMDDGKHQVVMHYDSAGRRLRVDSFVSYRPHGTVVFEPGPDGTMTARDAAGRLLASALQVGDSVVVKGPDGKVLKRGDVSELASLSRP
ncbi:MAG: DUF3332 family protein [Elusimicrobia bacterium]|nr:DUF3332 family protein [Elusimicrobiota bacterium]